MKVPIIVYSLLLFAVISFAQEEPNLNLGEGFAYEYRKFDNAIANFQRPPIDAHIQDLKNAIPLRLVIDFDELMESGPEAMPRDCFDDFGNPAYCQFDQIGENVISAYVDAIVILPFHQYPYHADNMQEDQDSDIDRRQEEYDAYTRQVNDSITRAAQSSSCEVISNSVYSVGYTTKFGYTVGIICPDDKTYRNNLVFHPDFHNNVMKATLGRTLALKPNLAEKINFEPLGAKFEAQFTGNAGGNPNAASSGNFGGQPQPPVVVTQPPVVVQPVGGVQPPASVQPVGPVVVQPVGGQPPFTAVNPSIGVGVGVGVGIAGLESSPRSKHEKIARDSELAEYVESDMDKRQSVSPVTGFDYSHPECGGVWYKDYLDGAVDGTCVGQRCPYIASGGLTAQFYLLDSGVEWRHPEFRRAVSEGRLTNYVVLNRTEYRRFQHWAVADRYTGVLATPVPFPVIVKEEFVPFKTVSSWVGLTKLPISPATGIPINSVLTSAPVTASLGGSSPYLTVGSIWTGPMSASIYGYYDYIEDPITDVISHGTSMAAIVLGENLGIAKRSTLTSYKVMTKSGMIEYAIKTAITQIVYSQRLLAAGRRSKPTVLLTGINFVYPHTCFTPTTNCALDTISGMQLLIRWGVVVMTPAMNGFVDVREHHFPPPGISVPFPYVSSFDSCHWAQYIKDVQPDADGSYDGLPAYFPQFLINGNEIFPYTYLRPMRITGFNHDIEMVPFLRNVNDSLGNSVLESVGFNFGDCIDYAVPGSEFENLAVLNKTVYGEQDIYDTGLWAFNETDSDYPGGITNWFESELPATWAASGKTFITGYKKAPFLSAGTSYSTPIAGVVVMSTLIAKWGTGTLFSTGLKPTTANMGFYMRKVFNAVNTYNRMPTKYQNDFSYNATYTGLENLNGIWGEVDPDGPSYGSKKHPAFRPIKMNKVSPTCVQ